MKDTDIVDSCVDGLLKTGFEKASVHFKSIEKTELNVEHNDTNLLRTAKEIISTANPSTKSLNC